MLGPQCAFIDFTILLLKIVFKLREVSTFQPNQSRCQQENQDISSSTHVCGERSCACKSINFFVNIIAL